MNYLNYRCWGCGEEMPVFCVCEEADPDDPNYGKQRCPYCGDLQIDPVYEEEG